MEDSITLPQVETSTMMNYIERHEKPRKLLVVCEGYAERNKALDLIREYHEAYPDGPNKFEIVEAGSVEDPINIGVKEHKRRISSPVNTLLGIAAMMNAPSLPLYGGHIEQQALGVYQKHGADKGSQHWKRNQTIKQKRAARKKALEASKAKGRARIKVRKLISRLVNS